MTGQDCTLEIHNVVGDTELKLDRFSFDISRPLEATILTAHLSGYLAEEEGKRVSARLAFASLEDFDLRAQMDNLTAGDVNIYLPA